MSNKTTSLELSKQLKEAGAKQESEQWWAIMHPESFPASKPYVTQIKHKPGQEVVASSFDCHELLEGLPSGTTLIKVANGTYFADNQEIKNVVICDGVAPAEALGKLYLWCLQNGHCSRSKEWWKGSWGAGKQSETEEEESDG